MPSSDSSQRLTMNPDSKRVETGHGDESLDAINRVPTEKSAFILLNSITASVIYRFLPIEDDEGEKIMTERAVRWHRKVEVVIDMRPDLESGGEPFVRIMEAVSTMHPGQTLMILTPFEPVLLYDVLAARGFAHETTRMAADEWVVRFTLP